MSDKNIEQVSPDTSTYPVVITIARDFGTEGHEIGEMLSTELGIPAYDESLAAEVAAFLPDRVDTRSAADKLFKQMEGVILDLGSTQSCIIEGRLSDYILRDNPNRISVLVTAPLDARVEIVRAKRGITEKKAKKLVKRMQRAREMFYKRYSAGKWMLHSGKDVVVNRARFGRQGCVDILAAAYRTKVAAVERAKQATE